jgi:hypothetical protein
MPDLRRSLSFGLTGLLLLTTGCAGANAPAAVPSAQQATIAGTSTGQDSAAAQSYVATVDGTDTPTGYGMRYPTRPMALTPGTHDIGFGVLQPGGAAFGHVSFDAEANKAYAIQFSGLTVVHKYCSKQTVWLADQQGKAASPQAAVLIDQRPNSGPAAAQFGLIGAVISITQWEVEGAAGWGCGKQHAS